MRVHEEITIAAPRERVWELICDPASYPRLLDWVTTSEPQDGDRSPGVGARYEMRVRVGSTNVGGLVEIVESCSARVRKWSEKHLLLLVPA